MSTRNLDIGKETKSPKNRRILLIKLSAGSNPFKSVIMALIGGVAADLLVIWVIELYHCDHLTKA